MYVHFAVINWELDVFFFYKFRLMITGGIRIRISNVKSLFPGEIESILVIW